MRVTLAESFAQPVAESFAQPLAGADHPSQHPAERGPEPVTLFFTHFQPIAPKGAELQKPVAIMAHA